MLTPEVMYLVCNTIYLFRIWYAIRVSLIFHEHMYTVLARRNKAVAFDKEILQVVIAVISFVPCRWRMHNDNLKSNKFAPGFIDTHCHLDFLFNKLHYKGVSLREFQKVLMPKDPIPESYQGCTTDFCQPEDFGKVRMCNRRIMHAHSAAIIYCEFNVYSGYFFPEYIICEVKVTWLLCGVIY